MPSEQQYSYGWDPDKEARHFDEVAKLAFIGPMPQNTNIPADLDAVWFIQDDQLQLPFCHAHMRTGMAEVLYWLATQGDVKNFSRYFAAITDMRMDGDDSRPDGASIGGSLRAAIKYGEAMEALMPYLKSESQYSNKIAPTTLADATHRSIVSIVPGIRDYAGLDAALTSGRTAVGIGMDWTSGFAAVRGKDVIATYPGGSVLGGHALFFFGWRTIGGERYPILHNSHNGWGIRRRAALAPKVVDYILKNSRYGAYAATNIRVDDPRPIAQPWDWVNPENFQSGAVTV